MERWHSAGDILCIPAAHSCLVTQAICSRGSSMRAMWVLLLWQVDCVRGLVSLVGPSSFGCQDPLCVEAGSCWLVGPGHEAADCRTPGGSRASAGHVLKSSCKAQGSQSWCQITGWGQFLTELGTGSRVSQSLCWSASGQGWGPASPRTGSDLL